MFLLIKDFNISNIAIILNKKIYVIIIFHIFILEILFKEFEIIYKYYFSKIKLYICLYYLVIIILLSLIMEVKSYYGIEFEPEDVHYKYY